MPILAIRAEDKTAERRAPLVPEDVRKLTEQYPDLRVVVQRYDQRAFAAEEYAAIPGVEIVDSVHHLPVNMGVKEFGTDKVHAGKFHVFYSHTFKGQRGSMELLETMLEGGCTIIDYEMLVEDADDGVFDDEFDRHRVEFERHQQELPEPDRKHLEKLLPRFAFQPRTVHFCHFAGIVGMFDSLWALGRRLDHEGIASPFAGLAEARAYGSWERAGREIDRLAEVVRQGGVPEALRPMVIGVTGFGSSGRAGKTAAGVFEVLQRLDAVEVDPADLASLDGSEARVLWARFNRSSTGDVGLFESTLRRMTILINAVRWMQWEDTFVKREFLRRLWAEEISPTMQVIGDLSCDAGGGVECCVPTTFDHPLYVYEAHRDEDDSIDWRDHRSGKRLVGESGPCRIGFEGRGPVVLAIDNLPTAFPREASEEFSGYLMSPEPKVNGTGMLLPYQMALLGDHQDARFEELGAAGISRPLRRAMIAYQGALTREYRYLQNHIDDWKRWKESQ